MNPLSMICLGAAGSIQLVLGARLLLLSRTTRGAPETLWGLTWFLAAIENFADAGSGAVASPEVKTALRTLVGVAFPLVVMALFFANYRLFRPGVAWARAVAIAVAVIMIAVFIWQVSGPGFDVNFAGTTRSLLNWADNLGMTIGLAWAGLEAARHHRMFEKRWRLGLAPRLLSLRYRLWSGTAGALVFFWTILWLRQGLDLPMWVMDVTLPTASGIGVVLMWMTFFPPAWLRRLADQEAPT